MEADEKNNAVFKSPLDLMSKGVVLLPSLAFSVPILFGAMILLQYLSLLGQEHLFLSALGAASTLIALGLAGALVIISLLSFMVALPMLFRINFNLIPAAKRDRCAALVDAGAIFFLICIAVFWEQECVRLLLGGILVVFLVAMAARELLYLRTGFGGGLVRILFISVHTIVVLLFVYPLVQWLWMTGQLETSQFILFLLAMLMLSFIAIAPSFWYVVCSVQNQRRAAFGTLFSAFFIPAVMVTTGVLGPLLPVMTANLMKVSPGAVEYLVKESDYPRSVMARNGFSTEVIGPSHYVLTAFSPYWVADVGILCPKEFELHKLGGGKVELAACLSVDTSIFSPASMKAVLGRKPDPVHSDDNG